MSYAEIVRDEVCLEGLDGITPESLWLRLEHRLGFELTSSVKTRLWNVVRSLLEVQFFVLPQARPCILIEDRLKNFYKGESTTSSSLYPYFPVKNASGSCEQFNSREDVTERVRNMTLEHATHSFSFNNRLVIVGSEQARWRSLAPGVSIALMKQIPGPHYCVLERIGRARHNGEITTGEHSLGNLGTDAKSMFYNRKLLLENELITKQCAALNTYKFNAASLLLHLPRFYYQFPQKHEQKMDFVEDFFKTQSSDIVLYDDFESFILKHLTRTDFKVLRKSTEFKRRVIIEKSIPYRQMYPDAPESVWTNQHTKAEKILKTVKLINDESITVENENDSKMETEEESTIKINSEPDGSGVIGETLLRQIYTVVKKSGINGMSKIELSRALGTNFLTIRLGCKYLQYYGFLYMTTYERNRQQIFRYYTNEYAKHFGDKRKEAETNIESLFKNKNSNDEVKTNLHKDYNKNQAIDVCVAENSNTIKSIEKHDKSDLTQPFLDESVSSISLKKLKRMNMILERILEKRVISTRVDLINYISQKEALTENERGIIDRRSLIRLLMHLECAGKIKIIKIKVNGPSSHTVLSFYCEPNIDINHPEIQSCIHTTKTRLYTAKKFSKASKLASDSSLGRLYGYVPKFLRMRAFHEFLFYLVYDHKMKRTNFKEKFQQSTSKDDIAELNDCEVFDDTPDNFAFVAPLLIDENRPNGWIMILEAIEYLPLCLFVKIVNINYHIPDLLDYLNHPIKRQLVLKYLPDTLHYNLRHFIKSPSFFDLIKNLCYIGLIKFGKQSLKDKHKTYIYINRHASLFDTTISKSGRYQIEDKSYPKKEFFFENHQDVITYWNNAYSICVKTLLKERVLLLKEEKSSETLDKKLAYSLIENTFETAKNEDMGNIPGDGKGACGFDSALYSHLKRYWYTSMSITNFTPIKRKDMTKKTVLLSYLRKKAPIKERTHVSSKCNIENKRKKNTSYVPKKSIKVSKRMEDDTDKKSLQILGRKRTTWNAFEDQMLFLCKIANVIMNPYCRKTQCYSVIRDILHKVAGSREKTSTACAKRMQVLSHKHGMSRNMELFITEIRRNEHLSERYYNLSSRLHIIGNSERINAYKILYIEFVQLLYSRIYSKEKNEITIFLPDSYDTLNKNYNLIELSCNVQTKISDATCNDIRSNVLSSFIHSALGCMYFKENKNFSLLSIYKKYSESFLRSVLYNLKTSGMITLRKSNTELLTPETVLPKTARYKLSGNYTLNLTNTFPFKIYSQSNDYLNLLNENKDANENLNILNSGATATLLELLQLNYITLNLTIPENIITINPKMIPLEDKDTLNEEDIYNFSSKYLSSVQLIEGNLQHISDLYIVNSCNLIPALKCECDIKNLSPDTKNIVNDIIQDAVFYDNNDVYNFKDATIESIFKFIEEKKDMGVTSKNILDVLVTENRNVSKLELVEILESLLDKNLIRRVGILNTRWIASKYLRHWFIKAISVERCNKCKSNMVICEKDINCDNQIECINMSDQIQSDKNICNIDSQASETILQEIKTESVNVKKRKHQNDDKINSNNELDHVNKKICTNNLYDATTQENSDNNIEINVLVSNESIETNSDKILSTQNTNETSKSNTYEPFYDDFKDNLVLQQCSSQKTIATNDNCQICFLRQVFADKHTILGDNFCIFPRPWIKPDGTLNFQLLCRWIGSILNYLYIHPAVKFMDLYKRFKYLSPYHLRLLLEAMEKIGCIKLTLIKLQKHCLWENGSLLEIHSDAVSLEENENLLIEIVEGALLKFCVFKSHNSCGKIMENK